MGAPLVPFSAPDDGAFAVKVPVNAGYDDASTIAARPGALTFTPDVSLAQVAMAGGRRSRRQRAGGCGCMRGGARRRNRTAKRGGGFAVDPSVSVGGTGPNAAAMYATLPCDPRDPVALLYTMPNPLGLNSVLPLLLVLHFPMA
jgi:hypothetical protein